MVEAIEEGKIVKVSERYAIREGLMILRKPRFESERTKPSGAREDNEQRLLMDDFRKPLNWKENKVVKELIDNFHWHIARERRRREMKRRELAAALGVSENTIKMIENGVLPKDDFVLINRIQEYLGINLRRGGSDFGQEMRKLVESQAEDAREEHGAWGTREGREMRRVRETRASREASEKERKDIFGSDIELIED